MLGDVIVSDGIVQYDLGRRLPERFERKDTLLDSLGRANSERKTLQDKAAAHMDVLQSEPDLAAQYPGVTNDRLF